MTENELSRIIIGYAIEVHAELGPGLLESTYEECLCFELERNGFKVERQQIVPVVYKGKILNSGYRADMIINNKVLIELKAVSELNDVHLAQTITYLKLSNLKLGLLINFNVALLKHGIRRVVNSHNI